MRKDYAERIVANGRGGLVITSTPGRSWGVEMRQEDVPEFLRAVALSAMRPFPMPEGFAGDHTTAFADAMGKVKAEFGEFEDDKVIRYASFE